MPLQKPLGTIDFQQECLFLLFFLLFCLLLLLLLCRCLRLLSALGLFQNISCPPMEERCAWTHLRNRDVLTKARRRGEHKPDNYEKRCGRGRLKKKKNVYVKQNQSPCKQCEGKRTASLFAFQAPKAGNKQQFLERDMLNTLPVGYGCAKRLCEIPSFCASRYQE